MKQTTVNALFFWFSMSLIVGLISLQVYKRNQLALNEVTVEPQEAPDFSLQDTSLSAHKGEWILLHFWATWCAPCRQEMPLLEELSTKLKDQLKIIAVAVDSPSQSVSSFFENRTHHIKVLEDPTHQVASLYGINQFPETLLIDPNGMIQAIYFGPQDWTQFEIER